jgi:hypothetical protein
MGLATQRRLTVAPARIVATDVDPRAPGFPHGAGSFRGNYPPGTVGLDHLENRKVLADRQGALPRVLRPAPDPMRMAPAARINPPPVIEDVRYPPFHVEKTQDRDVAINIHILPNDLTGDPGQGAETRVSGLPAYRIENITVDAHHKVNGYKFVWKGEITIQTIFLNNALPTDQPSSYGRGTGDDVLNGNVTLGFHEWCHQNDAAAYIAKSLELALTGAVSSAYILPESKPELTVHWNSKKFPMFRGHVGQGAAEFQKAVTLFDHDFRAFGPDLNKFKEACAHDVYYTLTQFNRDHPRRTRGASHPRRR